MLLRGLLHFITHRHVRFTHDEIGNLEICYHRFRDAGTAFFQPKIGNGHGLWQEVTQEEVDHILQTKTYPKSWGTH